MKSKIGFHIDIRTHWGEPEKIIRADTRLVKVISSMGLLNDFHHALSDKTIFIARDWKVTDDFMRFEAYKNPKDAAKRWLDGMRPSIVQAPFAYWESFNEMAAWDYLKEYGEFEAERQRLMAAEGFKACLFNFAVGTPRVGGDDDDWPKLYPALAAAHEYGNILGVHEYGDCYMDMWYGPNQHEAVVSGNRVPFPEEYAEGWLFGRYRKIWNLHLEPNGWTNVRIAITEFGIAPALTPTTTEYVGYPTGAWKACSEAWRRLDGRSDNKQFYVEQLQWCDRQMQKDDYMVGGAIFTWGTLGEWEHFEIEGEVADKLIAYIEQTKDEPPRPDDEEEEPGDEEEEEPGDEEEEPGDEEVSLYLTPIPIVSVWIRTGPGKEYDIFTSADPGDKLSALESEAAVLSKLNKEDQWIHVLLPTGEKGYVAAWLVERLGVSPPPPPPPDKLFVTTTATRGTEVRNGPGSQHESIATVFLGDPLEVLTERDEALANIGQSGKWIKIRTPRGMNGWVAAWLLAHIDSGDDGRPDDDGPVYLRVTVPEGLYVRSGPGPQHGPIASAMPGHRLEALGDPDDVRARVGKQGQWIQVKTPNDIIGWCAAWLLEEMPRHYVWPGGRALVGLHGPTNPGEAPWDEEAYNIVKRARIEAVKVHASADIGANVLNRLYDEGVHFIMARLFAKFEVPRTPQGFVQEFIEAALRLYNSGIRYFEVHNEPNLHADESPEGMWVAWQNGKEFGQFFQDSVKILRDLMPGAQFGFPGLSPGGDIEGVRASSEVFLTQADAAVRGADFVCMHTYWGGDGSTYLDSINKIKTICDRYPAQLIFVTEFSNTHPDVGKDVKGHEYAQFYTEAKKLPSNLGGLFSYVLSSLYGYENETWRGSPIPDSVGNRP